MAALDGIPVDDEGDGQPLVEGKPQVLIPVMTFLYTLDQIATMLQMPLHDFKHTHVYYLGRNLGRKDSMQIIARNIAADDATPDWRIAHQDFARWLSAHGFRVVWPARL